jgi:hypothetical protein
VLSLSKHRLSFFSSLETTEPPPSTARLRQALRTGFDKLRANGEGQRRASILNVDPR